MTLGTMTDAISITVNLLATGRQHDLQIRLSNSVGELKHEIERKCAIAVPEMRVMFNGRNLTDDAATVGGVGISEGAQIVVMIRLNMYNEVAGQTRIVNAQKDNYGNAVGNKFDLAKDGAFKGAKIAVLHLYTFGGFDFRFPEQALRTKGFGIQRWTVCPPPHELEQGLEDCCQLWMISSIDGVLTEPHMEVIRQFW